MFRTRYLFIHGKEHQAILFFREAKARVGRVAVSSDGVDEDGVEEDRSDVNGADSAAGNGADSSAGNGAGGSAGNGEGSLAGNGADSFSGMRSGGENNKKKQAFCGKCHRCHKVGNKQLECPSRTELIKEIAFTVHTGEKEGWLLDSGASSHTTPSKDDFHEYHELIGPIKVCAADGAGMNAIGRRSVRFRCGNGKMVTMHDVLHIPKLNRRLMSVPKTTQHGHDVRFDETHCGIFKDGDLAVSAKRIGSVYTLKVEHEHAMLVAHENSDNEWDLWHARTGHTSYNNYEKMKTATEGLPNVTAVVNEKLCGGSL
ncbi:hypothetical protein PsorP6_017463 [Peronosclerospora sorghi]|uniref:Uncharacterized protein n=1 Tax=Peronosclerospora sorghi TaxID=230839 RepID=A0ACC0WNI1_9STRA|nr:hypothetical protein PsorP6_017463 [Peronosclerospora sorghi]